MKAAHTLLAALALLAAGGCSRDKSSATSTSTSTSTASPKAFGEPCVNDGECAGGVCFHKRLKTERSAPESRDASDPVEHDGYCSMRCNGDGDCPTPPSSGRCGARGMCKRP